MWTVMSKPDATGRGLAAAVATLLPFQRRNLDLNLSDIL